jgi:hypothetical protein
MARRSRTKAFVDKHTGWSIMVTVAVGVLLVGIAVCGYAARCWGSPSGECEALRGSPPWTLLTALAATPAALLTWYWRTDHKVREIDAAKSQELTARFVAAVELLTKMPIGGIFALERIARDSPADHWAAMETLAAHLRGLAPLLSESSEERAHEREAQIQAIVTVLGRRTVQWDSPSSVLDLSYSTLNHINFIGHFENTSFNCCELKGANFRQAWLNERTSFLAADLTAAAFLPATSYDEGTQGILKAANAGFGDLDAVELAVLIEMRGRHDVS